MPSVHATIDNTLGAALLGGFITAIFYGITILQTFIFFQTYKKEGRLIKYTVGVLFVLDTAHMALVMHPIYWFLVTNFSNRSVLNVIPWSISGVELLASTSDTIVRCWFTWRVYIMSGKNLWLTAPLTFFVSAIFILDYVMGIRGFFISTIEEFAANAWNFYLALSLDVFTDFYIAGSLCYFLYRLRDTFNRRTYSLVNTLMVYSINTGLVTSIVLLATFITYAVMPHSFVFLALYFPSTKLYVNALLASLNARDWLRGDSTIVSVTIPMSDNPGPSRPVFAKFSTTGGHSTTGDIEEQISVHVDKEEFHAVV